MHVVCLFSYGHLPWGGGGNWYSFIVLDVYLCSILSGQLWRGIGYNNHTCKKHAHTNTPYSHARAYMSKMVTFINPRRLVSSSQSAGSTVPWKPMTDPAIIQVHMHPTHNVQINTDSRHLNSIMYMYHPEATIRGVLNILHMFGCFISTLLCLPCKNDPKQHADKNTKGEGGKRIGKWPNVFM